LSRQGEKLSRTTEQTYLNSIPILAQIMLESGVSHVQVGLLSEN
jgi:hypothetical protein